MGFGIASGILGGLSRLMSETNGPNTTSKVLTGVQSVVQISAGITDVSLQGSHMITKHSLQASSELLSQFGATDGEIFKEILRALGLNNEFSDSLLAVAKLISSFQAGIDLTNISNNLAILLALQPPLEIASAEGDIRTTEEVVKYLPWAMSVFDKHVRKFVGLQEKHSDEEQDHLDYGIPFIAHICGIPDSDVLTYSTASEVYSPAHFVALDRKANAVVISFRGTLSIADSITDLLCHHEPYSFLGKAGVVHQGFAESARRLGPLLEPLVQRALLQLEWHAEDKTIVLTGHSLGAAVATSLTAYWIASEAFSGVRIRAYAFASPCVFSREIATHPALQNSIYSIVIGDDLVPRLCRGSAWYLRAKVLLLQQLLQENPQEYHRLVQLAQRPEADPLEKLTAYYSLEQKEDAVDERLYPAGLVLYSESPGRRGLCSSKMLRATPQEHLSDILLSPNMFSDHLPSVYMELYPKV
eukprot:gene16169-19184_t